MWRNPESSNLSTSTEINKPVWWNGIHICSICRSKEFTKFYHNIIIIDDRYGIYEGHTERHVEHVRNLSEYYECDGCSVHFSNPKRFLIKKEKNNQFIKIGNIDEI